MYLDKIIARKEEEVRQLKRRIENYEKVDLNIDEKKIELKRIGGTNIIAEIKKKSPSKGELRTDLDPKMLAEEYIRAGAKAISVLTDRDFFGGSEDDFRRVVFTAREIPVLRKDFIIDEVQIYESAHMGADMILLIVKILTGKKLKKFIDLSREFGIKPLVEVHSREELETAIECGSEIVGINNRDLETFNLDIAVSEELLPLIPKEITKVVESGIRRRSDMDRLERLGADAFLIGEALITADDPVATLKILLEQKNERSVT